MTRLSLLTQGDWAEGTTAHNGGTMVAPLVLMGDTCNRIRVRTPGGGTTWGDGTPIPPPKTVLSHSIKLAQNQESAVRRLLATQMFTSIKQPTEGMEIKLKNVKL